MRTCSKCKSEKPDEAFARNKARASGFQSYCRECVAASYRDTYVRKTDPNKPRLTTQQRTAIWNAANPEKRRALSKAHYEKNKPYYHAKAAERRAAKRQAIPKWADLEAIKEIYAEAGKLNAEGKDVHVDHIVPLKHPLVCGLHTQANLEIISAQANRSKNNRHWPDMPELC